MNERDLFNAAVKLNAEERVKFLALACKDNPELREQVEGLLKAHFDSATFLHESDDKLKKSRMMETIAPAGTTEHPGTIIAGRYKLIEPIGEGGMGSVWLAEQKEPVKRKVAVKLIKAGMDSKQVLSRFEAERQALAMMDHPNIAKVFDGGMTDQGRPYFVMEFVKGVPLTEYCDQARLSLNERLNLFVPVCQAVQHAHQKGIIHRDLKPSNILICLYDGKPVPKVIDFGLAKAMHQSLTEHSLHTAIGMMVGTPLYMSPEQAEHNNLDVDTRTDIYSLGVILYELLTGSTPLEKLQLKEAAFNEILRLIKEVEPQKPSTRLSGSASLPSIAAQRSIDPNQLKKSLMGDLDWIVMKALDKERSRRYETANGLARDIDRFLNDEAVEACPPSSAYRLRKFIRRNRGQVIAASLVLFALVAGIVGTGWQAIRAENARVAEAKQREVAEENERRAESAKVEAQAKEAEANAVVAFFEDKVFAAARPKGQDGGLGKEVSLRDAIAASLPSLGQGFVAQPLVEARLRGTLGTTFRYLAEHEQARDQSEQSQALFMRHRGSDHPDTLKSMNNLANSYSSLNRPAEALKLREELLEIQKRVLPKDHPDTLMSMNNLAASYAVLNRPAEALKVRVEVLEIQQRVLPKDHPSTLMSMYNLANSYSNLNRPAEALKLREEVLEIQKRVLPKDHPDTLKNMSNLATSLIRLDRGAEAIPIIDEILAKAAGQAVDPRLIPQVMAQRMGHFQKVDDPAGCRATAEMWEKLNRPDAESLYNSACFRSITAGVQTKTPRADPGAPRLAKEDADRAMQWLQQAGQAGYKDAAHMMQDTDLEPLRERDDFKQLLQSLSEKQTPANGKENQP